MSDQSTGPDSAREKLLGRLSLAPMLTGLLVLAVVVTIVLRFTELSKLAALAHTARPEWLIVALLAQAATYLCATSVWRIALDREGYALPARELFPLGVAKLFMDQVVPAGGVGGAALVVRALARRNVPPPAVLTALLVAITAYYGAYLILVGTALVLMWIAGTLHPAALVAAGVFSVVAVGVPALLLYLTKRGNGHLPGWARRLPGVASAVETLDKVRLQSLKSPRLVAQAVGLHVGIFFLDSLTLWVVFRALGTPIALGPAISAFAMGSVAGAISLVPMGLGAFEAGSIGTLRLHGVPLESALAATLLLRGFTSWLPMLPGLWIARREIEG